MKVIIEYGDMEYILISDPTPTGRGREWKAEAKTIDGHPAMVYWMADGNDQIDIETPVYAELK